MNSFKTSPLPTEEYGVKAIPTIYKENKNVFVIVSRRFNGNLVVYEALLDEKRNLVSIEKYWLDVDPKYRKKARQKNKNNDRETFDKIHNYAYGMSIIKKISPKEWTVRFKQYKQIELSLRVTDLGVSLFQGKNDKIHHLFIADTTKLGLVPTVDYIDVVSVNKITKQKKVTTYKK